MNERAGNPIKGRQIVADKELLRRILDAHDKETGFVHDLTATPQKARELMMAQGVRPEENAFSCEIRRMWDAE